MQSLRKELPLLSPQGQSLLKDLIHQQYTPVSFSLPLTIIHQAVEAFFTFLKQPDPVKNHIDFTIAPHHRRGDVGFKRRYADAGPYEDSKEFFHFHPAIFKRYSTFVDEHPILKDFFLKANTIWQETYRVMDQILRSLEPLAPGLHSKVFETENPHILLRFLKYEWQESGAYLAKPHYDAGAFTLAIAESGPGLRIGHNPETLKPMGHVEGQALFMLSSNYEKVLPALPGLQPGWHDVIQVDKSLIGKPCARWAVVAFIEAHSVEALSREETHKWYTP